MTNRIYALGIGTNNSVNNDLGRDDRIGIELRVIRITVDVKCIIAIVAAINVDLELA